MDILFVTTELAPFVKVGGLADVSAALPKTLRTLGHAVTVVLPRFASLEEGGLLFARRLTPLSLPMGDKTIDVTLFDGRLASGVDLVLVDAPGLYDRASVYGERGEDYPDSDLRFAVLSRAAAEIARQRAQGGKPYDVVHTNDWPTALTAAYVEVLRKETPELAATKTVLTLHNVAHQGTFDAGRFGLLGLPANYASDSALFAHGKSNFLQQGIRSSDRVTTVSDGYAREIQTAAQGHGLEALLASLPSPLVGIANGVDYGVWNPATDAALASRFDAEDRTSRARCRGALQRELGFPLDPTAPILASVSRLVPQKGIDVLADAIPRLLRSTDAQIVVVGHGDPELTARIDAAARASEGRVVHVANADETLVHRVFAGSDFVLMPSRFEPCGLVQLYAQRYGALPVAHATGGLTDTIVDCDAELETGTGFLFDELTKDALVAATLRAVGAKIHPKFDDLQRRVMRLDRGWERPARRYEKLYKSVVAS
ncbi:MAG: glycogen/starch synthase [Polyangiaceae bacterium]